MRRTRLLAVIALVLFAGAGAVLFFGTTSTTSVGVTAGGLALGPPDHCPAPRGEPARVVVLDVRENETFEVRVPDDLTSPTLVGIRALDGTRFRHLGEPTWLEKHGLCVTWQGERPEVVAKLVAQKGGQVEVAYWG